MARLSRFFAAMNDPRVRAAWLDALAPTCPHCKAGDPFFDQARTEHVIRTEAGCGVTKCLANSGDGKHG